MSGTDAYDIHVLWIIIQNTYTFVFLKTHVYVSVNVFVSVCVYVCIHIYIHVCINLPPRRPNPREAEEQLSRQMVKRFRIVSLNEYWA